MAGRWSPVGSGGYAEVGGEDEVVGDLARQRRWNGNLEDAGPGEGAGEDCSKDLEGERGKEGERYHYSVCGGKKGSVKGSINGDGSRNKTQYEAVDSWELRKVSLLHHQELISSSVPLRGYWPSKAAQPHLRDQTEKGIATPKVTQ
jgi:hypothetical protein